MTAKRCTAIRKDGLPCEAFAADCRDVCASHDPEAVAQRRYNYPPCPTCGRHHQGAEWRTRSADDPAPPCPNAPWPPRSVRQLEARIARLNAELVRARRELAARSTS